MSSQISPQALVLCRDFPKFLRVFCIGEELDAVLFKHRDFRWQSPGLFILLRQLPGFEFAGFNVRLVERIDANNRAGYGDRNFPTAEFLAQIVDVRDRNSNYWLYGLLNRV